MSFLVLILIVAMFVVVAWKSGFGRSDEMAEIASWAAKESIVLTKVERKDFLRGPFFMRPNTQTVYRIQKKQGDQTVGGWILLSFMNKRVLDVIWEN